MRTVLPQAGDRVAVPHHLGHITGTILWVDPTEEPTWYPYLIHLDGRTDLQDMKYTESEFIPL